MPYLKKCDLIIEDEKTENDVANTILVRIKVPTRIAIQMLITTASSPSF